MKDLMFLATKVSSLLVATAFFVLPALTATASPQNLLYIQLSNYGRYAISDIWVGYFAICVGGLFSGHARPPPDVVV